ncbi:hypothetical protein RHMOL_Rhmol01G0164900 [Rhododendron molle]|uniref:Uncharacterized protein n=1 Tax=Rhododendron molle TaxID=49168 RepID=A0ACC0Q5G3_RHOML|nr:hypothetical protein RHMOL_Rhmol01G0164900 [Rhododendron molle]
MRVRTDGYNGKKYLPLKDINHDFKNYTIQATIVEKAIPWKSAKSGSQYQRFVLQDIEGTRIQATVFGSNIRIFENTLKLFYTYSITNAGVDTTPEEFRFLEQRCQLNINARMPVEEMKVDSLTMRSIKFNFTPIAMLSEISLPNSTLGYFFSLSQLHLITKVTYNKFLFYFLDVIFAILEVGECKPANNSYVIDIRIIDQRYKCIQSID